MKLVNLGRAVSASVFLSATLVSHLTFAQAVGQASAGQSVRVSGEKASAGTMATESSGADVDNSAVNKRDRSRSALTADQQSSGTSDTEITRQVRRALIADKGLSIYAHNIKIITNGGVVTLKGPVKSVDEQKKALSLATAVAGVSQVNNQISIKQ